MATLLVLPAQLAIPDDDGLATLDAIVTDSAYRPTIDFDDTTDEGVIFEGLVMPDHYAAGGIDVVLYGAMDSANTTDDIVMTAALERVAVGAVLGTTGSDFAAAQSATVTANDTANVMFTATISLTDGAQMDSVVAGDMFRLRIRRDADVAGDTAVGDFQLMSVCIKDT